MSATPNSLHADLTVMLAYVRARLAHEEEEGDYGHFLLAESEGVPEAIAALEAAIIRLGERIPQAARANALAEAAGNW